MSHTAHTYVSFLSHGVSLCKNNSMVLVTACGFHHFERRPSPLHLEVYHTGESFLVSSLYPNTFPDVSQWMCFSIGYTVVESVSGST